MIVPYLASSLVNLFKPENTGSFKLLKNPNSFRMKDFLINRGILVSLYSNLFTFKDSDKSFKWDGDLLKTLINFDFNVGHSNWQDQKLIYEFGKEMKFNITQKGRKINTGKTLINLLKSPAIMASRNSTIFPPSDAD